jgi:hypothetical protein
MFGLAPVVLLGLVGAIVYATIRHRHHPLPPIGPKPVLNPSIPVEVVRPLMPPRLGSYRAERRLGTTPARAPTPVPARRRNDLAEALTAWRDAHIISQEQAEQIEIFERAAAEQQHVDTIAPRPRRVPFVAEALGYLGGMLGIVGLVLLISRYWSDMATSGRLALGAGGTLAFGLAGYLVHEGVEPALTRLRWFLWILSSAAGALLAGVFVHRVIDTHEVRSIILGGAVMVAVQNGIFWAWRERPIQHLFTLAGLVTATGLAVAQVASDGPTGIAVMGVGVGMLLAGWRALTPTPPITAGAGAAAAIVGAAFVATEWQTPGLVVSVLTAAGMMTLAALPRGRAAADVRITLTVVAAIGLVLSTPGTIAFYAHRAGIATGSIMWAIGALLVFAAGRRWTLAPLALEIAGGLAIVGGAAVTGAQSAAFATIFGLVTAIGLIALGTVPGRVLMSLFGSLGLLVNVPWSILHFFPGEGRAPLLILTSGAVIVAVAVWLARMGGRLRRELGR